MDSNETDNYIRVNRYNLDGLESVLEQQNGDALDYFDRSLKFDKTDYNSCIYKARLLSNMGRNDESVEFWTKALKIQPLSYYALVGKGVALFLSGQIKESLESYQKASRINDKNPIAWYNIGNAYAELKNYRKAIESLNKSIKYGMKSAATWDFLGQFYTETKNFKKAADAFRRGLKLFPNDVGLLTDYANFLLIRRKSEKALYFLNKAVLLDSNNETIWYNKGCAFSQMNEIDKAIDCLLVAGCIDPKDSSFKKMIKDPDLQNIKNTPQFKKLKTKLSNLLK